MKMQSFFGRCFSSLILLFLFGFPLGAQTTVVTGRLLDVAGKPSRHALVGIVTPAGAIAADFVKCDDKGNYSINLVKPGQNFLMYSIPSHSALRIPVQNNKDKAIKIDVTLTPYKYKDDFADVFIAGSFNNFDINAPEVMTKGEDGIYRFEVKSDLKEIGYQLCRITRDERTINAPESTAFEPDSSGDYRSIIPVKDGKVTITFDPSKLLKSDLDYKATFTGSEFDEKIFHASMAHSKISSDASKKISEFIKEKKNLQNYNYDGGTYFSELLAKIDNENNPELRDYYKLLYISSSSLRPKDYNFEKATAYFESLSPENPAWEAMPNAFYSYYSLIPQYKWAELQDNFLMKSKNITIKLSLLSSKLANAKFSGNEEELKKIHAMIQMDFAGVKEAQDLLKRFPIESKIKVGTVIPDFEAASLDNPGEKFSKQNMLGKIYMIDFWATWCGPCVGEMDALHKAYEKFKDKGFEILSLSLDASADDVVKFRNDKWKMPWKNSFIGSKEGRKIAEAFEVIGIPRPILVGADGKILEMEGELRGGKLQQTLAKYFK